MAVQQRSALMSLVTLIGYCAALCTMVSFAPQAWRIIRTRETNGISAWMYGVSVAGFILWLTFGFLRAEWPIIIPNAVCFVLAGFILTLKLLPQRKRERVADKIEQLAPLPSRQAPPAHRR